MIAALTIEALLYTPGSLKEKRSVTKSAADHIRRRWNVSFAETGHQEVWQRAEWVAVSVSGTYVRAQQELQHVLDYLDSRSDIEVIRAEWEQL
ncbi:DUF503 domain-containing protein [Alkalicoccus urumqiensis]|uniref:DUF503 domain-containing protein n=1 Tax=Alkalicoccus urumqiensis TaxID=1548213 RepID=A0A2P6MFY0_ALKUR|nr:DUF503 domain-containing protein [Alkalicoccus urumqiensis]PRO65188.1 DUF503 domain-containing protein [Alkalicoccus urumqiensis]